MCPSGACWWYFSLLCLTNTAWLLSGGVVSPLQYKKEICRRSLSWWVNFSCFPQILQFAQIRYWASLSPTWSVYLQKLSPKCCLSMSPNLSPEVYRVLDKKSFPNPGHKIVSTSFFQKFYNCVFHCIFNPPQIDVCLWCEVRIYFSFFFF